MRTLLYNVTFNAPCWVILRWPSAASGAVIYSLRASPRATNDGASSPLPARRGNPRMTLTNAVSGSDPSEGGGRAETGYSKADPDPYRSPETLRRYRGPSTARGDRPTGATARILQVPRGERSGRKADPGRGPLAVPSAPKFSDRGEHRFIYCKRSRRGICRFKVPSAGPYPAR